MLKAPRAPKVCWLISLLVFMLRFTPVMISLLVVYAPMMIFHTLLAFTAWRTWSGRPE